MRIMESEQDTQTRLSKLDRTTGKKTYGFDRSEKETGNPKQLVTISTQGETNILSSPFTSLKAKIAQAPPDFHACKT